MRSLGVFKKSIPKITFLRISKTRLNLECPNKDRIDKQSVPIGFYVSDSSITRVYAGINLTGYHPPGLTPGPLIFSVKSPNRGQLFSANLRPPGREN